MKVNMSDSVDLRQCGRKGERARKRVRIAYFSIHVVRSVGIARVHFVAEGRLYFLTGLNRETTVDCNCEKHHKRRELRQQVRH